jgi:hypothetical protein
MRMKIYIWPVLAIFLLFSTAVMNAQVYNTQVEAKIKLQANTEYVEISGLAYNKTNISQSLRYVLSVIKNDAESSNRTKNDQSGRVVLDAGQQKILAKTTINQNYEDRIIILLLVYNTENQLMGKDRIVLNDTAEDKKIVISKEEIAQNDVNPAFATSDGIELRGVVLEETKTRPGREFFTKFAGAYRNSGVEGARIVSIKEVLAIANNTQIEVRVGDEIVMQFFVRPQNDYIEAMVEAALKRVIGYFRAIEEDKIVVKQY